MGSSSSVDTTATAISIDTIGTTTDIGITITDTIDIVIDTSLKSPPPVLSSPPLTFATTEDTTGITTDTLGMFATTGITDTTDIEGTEDTEPLAMCKSYCRTSESSSPTRVDLGGYL